VQLLVNVQESVAVCLTVVAESVAGVAEEALQEKDAHIFDLEQEVCDIEGAARRHQEDVR